jgi:hypothetical protein
MLIQFRLWIRKQPFVTVTAASVLNPFSSLVLPKL